MWVTILAVAVLVALACPVSAGAVAPDLSGTVTDAATGDPVAGVWMDLYSYNTDYGGWDWQGYLVTNSSGVYSFDGLTSGVTNALSVYRTGYEYYWVEDIVFAGTPLTLDIELTAVPKSIHGTVTDSRTDAAIVDASVELYYDSGGGDWWWWDWATSDESGDYSFYSYIGAGDFYVSAEAPDYWTSYSDTLFYNGSDEIRQDFSMVAMYESTADAYEPDNRIVDAKRIAVDGSVQERTIAWNDPDYIKVPVRAGKAYHVQVGYNGMGYVWGRLSARDGANVTLAEVWISGGDCSLSFTAEKTGWVYVEHQIEYGSSRYSISVGEAEPSAIVGIVSDEDTDEPIEDVSVVLLKEYATPYEGDIWWDWADSVETDGDGAYEFLSLIPDTYSVLFDTWYTPEYLSESWNNSQDFTLDPIVLNPGDVFQADAQLGRGGTLVGHVTDELSGEPLAGVYVQVFDIDDMSGDSMSGYETMSGYDWAGSDYTASDGSFAVSSLRPGSQLAILFWDDSGVYDIEWYDDAADISAATPITLAAGETRVADGRLRIDPAFGGVRGVVSDEVDGVPIADIWVEALMSGYDMSGYDMSGYDMSGYDVSGYDMFGRGFSTYTYPDGTYRLGRFWAGTKVALGFSDPFGGYLSGYYDNPGTPEELDYVEVIGGQMVRGDKALARNPGRAFLEGTVLDAETGEPFRHASVYVEQMSGYDMSGYDDLSGYSFWSRTDSDGHYRVRGLFPDTKYIASGDVWTTTHVTQYFDHKASYQKADLLSFAPGEIRAADFDIHKRAKLSGVVTEEGTGAPIGNVQVQVLERTTDGMSTYRIQTGYTDRAGRYKFDWLSPDGDYVLRFDTRAVRGYVSEYHDDAETEALASTIKLVSGHNTLDASLAIAADAGSIGGVVLDEYGRIASDVAVEVYSMDFMSGCELVATGLTDDSGAWSVPRMPSSGQYLVGFSDPFGRYVDEFFDDAPDIGGATIVPVVAGETTPVSAVLAMLAPDFVSPEIFDDAVSSYDDEASFSIWATDDDAGVSKLFYRLNDGDEVEVLGAGPETITSTNVGENTLVYWAKDRAGNVSVPAIVEFTVVDTIAPETGDDAKATYDDSASIALSASDSGSGVDYIAYRLDGAATQTVSGTSAVMGSDLYGDHELVYWAADNAGNKSDKTTREFTVGDTIAPETDDDAEATYDDGASITLSASDAGSGVDYIAYRLDGAATQTVSGDSAVVDTDEYGDHTLVYWAADKTGNMSSKTTRNFTVGDTIAPETDDDAKATYDDGASIALSASDAGSGVDYIAYRLDGDATQTVSGENAAVNVYAYGDHDLVYWAADNAGNVSSKTTRYFTVGDSIAPETGDNAKATYFSSATITLTASDAGSGVDYIAYRLDGGATQTVDAVSTAVSTSAVGNHNLSYWAADNAGNKSDKTLASFAVLAPAQNHTPVQAQNRYGMAVAIAKEAFPGWVGVKHVVIASGEDRAAADPLAAAGLCGVYDAPLLLLRGASLPSEVADAIRAMPDDLAIHVVGGPNSVPKSLLTQLRAIPGVKSVERLPYGDRYQTAAEVAKRMKTVLVADGGSLPTTALIANGADPNKFADALALSPISTSEHYPVLLVKADSIPGPTQAALTSLGLTTRIIGGGPATVKDSVKKTLGAERWSGDDRYATARTIATKAIGRGWLEPRCTGIAAKLADALTGGSLVGRMNGVLLLTRSESLSAPTAEFLKANKAAIEDCYVFGGTASVSAKTRLQIDAALK